MDRSGTPEWDPVDLGEHAAPRGDGGLMTGGKVEHKGEVGVWILTPSLHQVLDSAPPPRTRVVVGTLFCEIYRPCGGNVRAW